MASVNILPKDYGFRIIKNYNLKVFEWEHFKVSTEYLEPYDVARAGNNSTMVSKENTLPQRKFTVEFPTLFYLSGSQDRYWIHRQGLSLNRLINFYEMVGTHESFIFRHPVYGDCVCRFLNPLEVPKRNVNGLGSVESFQIVLIEENTSSFFLHPSERQFNDLTFGFPHHTTVVKYPETSLNLALGNNYTVKVRDHQKPLRTFNVTIPFLRYVQTGLNKISFEENCGFNALRLELFYLNKRLSKEFIFNYEGEDVTVKFNSPLKIPKVTGNMGSLINLELELRESRGRLQVLEVEELKPFGDPCTLTSKLYPLYTEENLGSSFTLDFSLYREPLNQSGIETENVKSDLSLNTIYYRTPIVKLPIDLEEVKSEFTLGDIYFRSTVNNYDLPMEEVKTGFSLKSIMFRTTVNKTEMDLHEFKSSFTFDHIGKRGAKYTLNVEDEYFTTNFEMSDVLFRTVMGKYSLEPEKTSFGFEVLDSQIVKEVIFSNTSIEEDKTSFGFEVLDSQIVYSVDYLGVNQEVDSSKIGLKLGSAKVTRKVRYLNTSLESYPDKANISLKLGSAKVTLRVSYPKIEPKTDSAKIGLKLGSVKIK